MPRSLARLSAAVLVALAAALAPAAPAAAHNQLTSASPAKGAALRAAPTAIVLRFLEELDPAFTTVVLTDGAGQKVPTGEAAVAGTKGTVPIRQPLANGSYKVAYRVVSVDGHLVQGAYPFTVADPAAPAPPTPTPATATGTPVGPEPTPAAAAGSGGPPPWLLAAAAVAVLAAAAGGWLLVRRAARRRA
ncbi:hypothetical protein GCM10010124_22360 [Pilimelia terevasa]|uniref:CopC domain-containing protein n=1 Tax=Pilimelia terevasa TaxID=53372 RepID=A0A8J3BKZ9_9ACTN|nr:copper resistance CopC family protein [Pilimelia terevasa]GGK29133.1 hypothetical protein GCM10010124_22360 [Pilimelia terevasa]